VVDEEADMAQVFNRKGIWYARIQYAGKDVFRSTGIKVPAKGVQAIKDSKKEALIAFERIEAELTCSDTINSLMARLDEALDRLPQNEQVARRIALSDRLRANKTNILLIKDAWSAWLYHPNRGAAGASTVKQYQMLWGGPHYKRGFTKWLQSSHPSVIALHEITEDMAESYATHLRQQQYAPRTYNGIIKFLASMFRTLRSQAGLNVIVWESIRRMPAHAEGRRNLMPDELSAVCAKATGDYRYLIALGLYTGLRFGDCLTLKWNAGWHINGTGVRMGVLLDEKVIRWMPSKTRRTKKLITIPLHPVLQHMLSQLKQRHGDSEYLFPQLAEMYLSGKAYTISNAVQRIIKECGIETTEHMADGSRKRAVIRVGFHSLRHSFVSLCAANNVPQAAIQELVGHGNPAMTALYTHADHAQRAMAISSLPDLGLYDQGAWDTAASKAS
jgi:integrase